MGYLEQLGKKAQEKAIKLSVEGLSHGAIADELNKEFNATLTTENVGNYLRRQTDKSSRLLKEDKNYQSKLTDTYWDTIVQLRSINSEIVNLFYELRKTPDEQEKIIKCPHCNKSFKIRLKNYLTLLKTADVILSQIRHVDRVLGKLQKKSLNINYNIVEISKKIAIAFPELLLQMEKRGVVKLNKRRFKSYYGGKKMVVEENLEEEEDFEEEEPIEA